MSDAQIIYTLGTLLTVIMGILAYLLKQKDEGLQKSITDLNEKHEKEVKLLWEKHDHDAQQLEMLKLQIAREHYIKGELDTKFDKIENAITEGFKDVGKKFDNISMHIQAIAGITRDN